MQIGIRLHDINTKCPEADQTMEARAAKAREEGFSCVHLAYQKVIKGYTWDDMVLTEGLAKYTKRVFDKNQLDVAVLGCYMNLATPDPVMLDKFKKRYYGHLRVASVAGCCMVGTETGAPNTQYKMDENTHGKEALDTFIRNLADVVEAAENYGVTMAIEPVWKHIVYNADRAVEVLNAIQSQNLRIIFDPVNILYSGNIDNRDYIIADAMDKLGEKIAMVHLKDFVPGEKDIISVAAGTGEMGDSYDPILKFMKTNKPYIHTTLENTTNENAVWSKNYILDKYNAL